MGFQSVEEDVDHGVDGAFAAGADEFEAEVLVEEAVVEHHSHEAAGDEGGVDGAEGAEGGLLFDEAGHDAVDDLAVTFKEVLGKLVLFQRREEDEPEIVGVFGLELDDHVRQAGEEGVGVVAGGEALEGFAAFLETMLGGGVDDGGVELALGLEVFVENRLGDAAALGELAGGAAAEADFGEELGGGVDDGFAPVCLA